ncbi:DUF3549 family protein, partial [Vibrio cholerae]|nr:DUF3549 family protein [Vibrio cholerae]
WRQFLPQSQFHHHQPDILQQLTNLLLAFHNPSSGKKWGPSIPLNPEPPYNLTFTDSTVTREDYDAMTAALTELLTRAQVKACFYDLGRRPYPLSLATFGMLENQQRPYPYPLRGQAHLALCCQRPSESEP